MVSARAALVMAAAAVLGMIPSLAWTRARAASTSSMACRRHSSENSARIDALPKSGPKIAESAGLTVMRLLAHVTKTDESEIEKDRLVLALQNDIEAKHRGAVSPVSYTH